MPDDARTARPPASVLGLVQRLKEQILAKEQQIGARASALVQAHEHLQSLFAALGDAVLVLDREGRLEFVNPAAEELLGLRSAQLVGLPVSALLQDPDQAAQLSGARWEELVSRPSQARLDLALSPREGAPIPVSASASVLQVEGRPGALVLVARDVRPERSLEEERLRAVRALAASVAHEIRNPLSAIQSSIGLLRRDLPLGAEDRQLVDIVIAEAERIGRIVTHFLDFARARPLAPEPVDVGALLRAVATLAEHDERAAARALTVEVAPDLPEIECDPGQVKQVVWNLLANALDAARARVALRAAPAASGGVEVRVEDDGPGIPPEVLARAGEPFLTRKATGTGLGLAISRRIVEAHGGALRLLSVPGAGSTAAFVLPARPPDSGGAGAWP